MAVDWTRTRATVKRMIDLYGRPITLVNDAGLADSNDPLGPPAARLEVPGVSAIFVRPSGYIKLGESFQMDPGMWEEADKICLVLPSLIYDFAHFTRVIDTDSQAFKIYKVEDLTPGPVPILLYLGLRL